MKTPDSRAWIRARCLLAACFATASTALLAARPDRPIKFIVPFPPGGATGNVGADAVAKAD